MIPIIVHGHEIHSVFDLLGTNENSITYSLGWALSRSPDLLRDFSIHIGAPENAFDRILLQEHGEDGGYTDIELLGPKHHAIVEAKRGWWLPAFLQWSRYAERFDGESRTWSTFVAMSDCTSEYARTRLPRYHGTTPISYIGWRDLEAFARTGGTTHAEKRLLSEFALYLRGVTTMQSIRSNVVYVVSLAGGTPEGGLVSWIQIVKDHRRYFHPVGKGWPKEPPNYIAFRYGGRLQSIHHVDRYVVTIDSTDMPGLPPWDWSGAQSGTVARPHFLYTLGPPIVPPHVVPTGNHIRQSARVWVMFDLLLTSETISEAFLQTKERIGVSANQTV